MKKWMVTVLVAALSAGMFCFQGWLMSKEGFDTVRPVDEDYAWCVFDQEHVPRREADGLVAADGVVYLHYEKYGYVNAYRTDGTFLRGYQVAAGRNGVGGIGYADGILYIDGQCSGIYLFREGELVGFEEQSTKNPFYKEAEARMASSRPVTDGGYTYYYDAAAGQIGRFKPGQALETVVQLPVKDPNVETLIYANLVLWILFICWLRAENGEIPPVFRQIRERKQRQLR